MNFAKDILEIKIVSVIGEPWYWKSFLSLFLAVWYHQKYWKQTRIFSNIDFFYKNKKINNTIKWVEDAKKIEFSKIPWLCIIDEGGQNINARRAMSDDNIILANELWALARKKNLNVVYIAQLDRMLDIYIRELSFLNIRLLKPTRDLQEYPDGRLIFHIEMKKKEKIIWYRDLNLFELLLMGYSYNTLEISKLEKTKKKERKKEKEIINFF